MTQDLYRNSDFIPNFADLIAETAARSRELSGQLNVRPDVPYGPGPRERMDIIFPKHVAKGAPIHMFIHGGYWRSGNKQDHWLVAPPALEAGAVVAIVGYDLMPDTRLGTLVNQVRSAARQLAAMAPELGADASRLTATGHSAGAHLASFLAAQGPEETAPPDLADVSGLLLLSGIYDLSEIPDCFLKDEAKMTHAEARAWTPLTSHQRTGPRRIVMLSEHDTPPYHIQGEQFTLLLTNAGHDVDFRVEPGLNHLSIVLELNDPRSAVSQCLIELIEQR